MFRGIRLQLCEGVTLDTRRFLKELSEALGDNFAAQLDDDAVSSSNPDISDVSSESVTTEEDASSSHGDDRKV